MTLLKGWLREWKEIAQFCSMSVKTAKKYHKKYGMPVRRGPGNKPHAIIPELHAWLVEFDKKKKKMKNSSKYLQNLPKTTPK